MASPTKRTSYTFSEDFHLGGKLQFYANKPYKPTTHTMGSDRLESETGIHFDVYSLHHFCGAKITDYPEEGK